MNKAIIVGRLGKDPDLKPLERGPVCTFSMATSEKWKDARGEQMERTEWHRIVAFGKLAEICGKYLTKGAQALVEGKIQTRSWEDEHGQKRYSTEIVAAHVEFLGSKRAEEQVDPEREDGEFYSEHPEIPF